MLLNLGTCLGGCVREEARWFPTVIIIIVKEQKNRVGKVGEGGSKG